MSEQTKIAGGVFVFLLMFFLTTPLNDEVQGYAQATGASEGVIAIALIFPYFWVGITFIVLAFTGWEITQQIET
jgi:hypothetical protein